MLSEILMQTDVDPYPGLRAFKSEEAHLFFGRDEQIDSLLEKLEHSHFVAVVGPSGCGKSSLVKAGLVPAIRTGFFLSAGTKWKVAEMRPGNDPYKNLSTALLSVFDDDASEYIKAELKRSPKGLSQLMESGHVKGNFLLIVDQFEELFRYKQNNNIDEVTGFINLLIESVTQPGTCIHVIITMRSDFLGQCSLFLGLPEILNDNQFLTPRLTREQTKEAIEGPAMVCGGSLEPKLVTNLLNDIGVDHDQLPLLQHALMRMWNLARKKTTAASEETAGMLHDNMSNDSFVLTMDEYDKIGKLSAALSQHANEIFDHELDDTQRRVAEILFKRLSERNAEQKDNRRLATVEDIARVAEVSNEEVINVADIFRTTDNSFLMPPSEVALTAQSFLDISHESLLRQWDKMKVWIEKEYEDATIFKRLVADSNDYFKENGGLLSGIKLINVLKWISQPGINENWAIRYSDQYQQVRQYIDKSKEAFDAEKLKADEKAREEQLEKEKEIREEQEREKERAISKRNKIMASISIIAAIVSLSFGILAYTQGQKAKIAIQEKAEANQRSKIASAKAEAQRKIDSINAQIAASRKIDSINAQIAAQRRFDSINAQREIQRKIDIVKNEAETKKRIDSIKTEAAIQKKIDSVNAEIQTAKTIDSANTIIYSVLDHLQDILGLVNKPFYKSVFFDSAQKNKYVRDLVVLKYKEHNDTKFNALLDNLNIAANIYDGSKKDPNDALTKAQLFDKTLNNELSESTLLNILNNNFFYRNMLNLYVPDNTAPVFALSPQRSLIAIKLADTIKISRFSNDGLTTLRKIFIQKQKPANKKLDDEHPDIKPAAVRFTDENNLIVFANNYLYKVNITTGQFSSYPIPALKLRNYEFSYTSAISPDGKKLAIDYGYSTIKIWDIDNINRSSQVIKLNSSGAVNKIGFSFDSKSIIVNQTDHYSLINTLHPDNQKVYNYAVFTPDRKYVVVQPRSTGSIYELYDVNDSTKNASLDFGGIGIKVFDSSTAKLISLSPDWKYLIIKTSLAKNNQLSTYHFRQKDNDSIFQFKRNAFRDSGSLLPLPYLNYSEITFNNDNQIIGLSNNKTKIKLWVRYDSLAPKNGLDAFINNISPAPNAQQDAGGGKLDSSNEKELVAYANQALKKDAEDLSRESLNNVKILYGKLSELNAKKYVSKYRGFCNSYFTYYRDTMAYIKDLTKLISLESTDTSKLAIQNLSSDYWNLSWFSLFNRDFNTAILSAGKGFDLNPKNNGIKTNLALGYLLSGQCEKANGVYTKYKDSSYLSDSRKFNDAFLQDLIDLQNAGIITPDNKVIYAHVQKIRLFLNGKLNALDCK